VCVCIDLSGLPFRIDLSASVQKLNHVIFFMTKYNLIKIIMIKINIIYMTE